MSESFPLIWPDWNAPSRVRACVTTRKGGVSQGSFASFNLGTHVGDNPEHVAENRKRLADHLGISQLTWLNQVHGIDVHRLPGAGETVPCGDASVTTSALTACVVMTADCLPVLLCDRDGSVVAAAHAGWRGLNGGVLEAAVSAMAVEPSEIMAWLGPAISQPAFEVGPEVYQMFTDKLGDVSSAFCRGDGDRWMADMYRLARMTLNAAGVRDVSGGDFCTYHEPERFYSYRRQSTTGRMASLIWLENEQ